MRQSPQTVKALRLTLRRGDAGAARLLLGHSLALGHKRLAVRRYFEARFLGAEDLGDLKSPSMAAAGQIPPAALLALASDAARIPGQRENLHLVASELLRPEQPVVLSYQGTSPHLATALRFCGRRVSILGRAKIGANAGFGTGAVVRADGHFVKIGDDFCLGEMSTVHIAHELYPTIIGDRVSVGRNAVVHACSVGNDCLIEDSVVILDGTTIEDQVLVEAGSTVFPRSTLKSGLIYSGSPAKPVREINLDEIRKRELHLRDSVAASLFAATGEFADPLPDLTADVFLADTANITGRINASPNSSVFFGSRLDAAGSVITIGANSNIQDNTVIDASAGPVTIGPDTTIGHNVLLRAGRIGANSLIGIGSTLAPGTIIDDDVLLAAGSGTLPGQHLKRGWLWAGRPARPISALDERRRAMMSAIIKQYCAYGTAYRLAQEDRSAKGGSNGTSLIAHSHANG
ncbi:gamma carbonic anhydrase family protein (plasmid) [Agrobacterium leguminum]|uniref:gamma carbonic anhydrase family protein n=1 Tax=Agrobacterium leguminum TaxID=2792015 RepID=UPI0030D50ABF